MSNQRPIRVGSRGSPLALIQDDEAIAQLKAHGIPGLEFEVVVVRTTGDANQTARRWRAWGWGVFVSETRGSGCCPATWTWRFTASRTCRRSCPTA